MVRGGRAEAPVPCSDVSFRFDQNTAIVSVEIVSSEMQWSPSPEEKQNNQLAQTEFRFIKTITIIKEGASTSSLSPSPLYQRCTAAKDGKLQGGHREQSDAVESFD